MRRRSRATMVAVLVLTTIAPAAAALSRQADSPGPIAQVAPAPIPDGGRFFDDDSSIFQASIEAIAGEGITRGCNPPYQTGFCPEDPVTRGQMAAFLVRAFQYTENGGGNLFTDDDTSVFEGDIDRLAAAGVTRGCDPPQNTRFCPGDPVTRGQMAAFLVRALGYDDDGGGDLFTDDDASVFEGDIDRLAAAGVTRGCNPPENTRFCPGEHVTRGQMAAFLARALELAQPPVPERRETTAGIDLEVLPTAEGRGCSGEDGEVCVIAQDLDREFYLLTGWLLEDWSGVSPADRSGFQSGRVRLEARFDGVPIDLVAWPFEVVDDVAFKTYSFQFPGWLSGDHVLEVFYVDDTQGFLWTIRDNLTTHGSGYGAPGSESGSDLPVIPQGDSLRLLEVP